MNWKLIIPLLLFGILISPALATSATYVVSNNGTPTNAITTVGAYWYYDPTVSGEPVLFTVQRAGVQINNYYYWTNSVGHDARFNLSYNNHNYSTVHLVATDVGYNTIFNGSAPWVGREVRFDYYFDWVDPAMMSLPGLTQFTSINPPWEGNGNLYDNLTNSDPAVWGVGHQFANVWFSQINNTANISSIGLAPAIAVPYGSLYTDDSTYTFVYGAGATPPSATNSSLSGYVNNAYTNATISGAGITSVQGTSLTSNTSMATGYYKISNMIDDVQATITGSKSGYSPQSFSFTPTGITAYTANISLMPSVIPNSTAIIGIVYRSWDGAPIQSATVTLSNATWSGSYTTTMTGFYMFNGLPAGSTYTVSASATGYAASAGYSVTTSSAITVQQDIPMSSQFAVTLTAKDGSTGSIIQSTPVFFESSDGQTANTTTGTTTFTVNGGYHTFTASATGYTAGQQSATVVADTSLVILLYKSSESSGIQISVPPHHVKFIVRNQNGIPLDNVLVTAQGEETTVGTWDWLLSIFGISGWTSTPIHNTSMTGYTDSRGEIDFLMFPEIKYNMSFVKSGFINNRTYLYPHYDEYSIVVPSALWFVNGSDVNRYINWSITRTLNSDTDATITVRYNDTFSHTSKIIMDLRKADNANSMSRTPIANCSWTGSGGSSLTCSFHVADYRLPANNSYYLNGTSLTQDFGRVQRDFGITFPLQQPLEPFHLPDLVLFLISALILFLVGMLFGATSTAQGSLVVCIVAWVFWFMGMMDYIANMNPVGFFIGLALATVTAVFANFTVAQRQEGYP